MREQLQNLVSINPETINHLVETFNKKYAEKEIPLTFRSKRGLYTASPSKNGEAIHIKIKSTFGRRYRGYRNTLTVYNNGWWFNDAFFSTVLEKGELKKLKLSLKDMLVKNFQNPYGKNV